MLLNWVIIQYHLSTSLTNNKFTHYILSLPTLAWKTYDTLYISFKPLISIIFYITIYIYQLFSTGLTKYLEHISDCFRTWLYGTRNTIQKSTCSWSVLGGIRCRTSQDTYANRVASLFVFLLQPYVGSRQPFFRAHETDPQAPPV